MLPLRTVLFLDTSIMCYLHPSFKGYRHKDNLLGFVQRKQGLLFCTETIKDEYLRRYDRLPHFVSFLDSGIERDLKESCTDELLQALFSDETARMSGRSDMMAVLEAGVALVRIAELSAKRPVRLLTSNMGLYQHCVKDKEEVVEQILNAYGLEHLVPVVSLRGLEERNFDE
eukprot:TRINITY_DN10528_c0_g2_i1.p1 TRINITY_DN10528_c0_g2~~TRINITY_DN10528_c0_g2_i1.p1  ORF type:complete len:172 (-),score=38.09 TRINITY_DN10528_c0_g2_i1:71-586(-)